MGVITIIYECAVQKIRTNETFSWDFSNKFLCDDEIYFSLTYMPLGTYVINCYFIEIFTHLVQMVSFCRLYLETIDLKVNHC